MGNKRTASRLLDIAKLLSELATKEARMTALLLMAGVGLNTAACFIGVHSETCVYLPNK